MAISGPICQQLALLELAGYICEYCDVIFRLSNQNISGKVWMSLSLLQTGFLHYKEMGE